MTDQPTLRDRIRRAICEANGFEFDDDGMEPDEYGDHADAVMAVLPAPVDRAACDCEAEVHMGAGIYHHPWCATKWPAAVAEAEARRLALSQALGLGTGAPWDAIQERAGELHLAPVDRAAVLRELEARYRRYAQDSIHPVFSAAYAAVANDMSRMADEAQQPEEAGR
ncbi:hypothetical protein CG740_23265 [Streptomyces sp. CB01201]|uniref:hypothetical protein n=1 Tax=Streptomyces sp. CB01201 TaxID=2020324 RepID=UPI000C280895|nr:hypothetical protein [Streptomyces sp. CB01201]PJN00827.1 hypothetical protein CG740_23265 [Streptomyces sp. CB01201]